jgi:hypothetical protein
LIFFGRLVLFELRLVCFERLDAGRDVVDVVHQVHDHLRFFPCGLGCGRASAFTHGLHERTHEPRAGRRGGIHVWEELFVLIDKIERAVELALEFGDAPRVCEVVVGFLSSNITNSIASKDDW